MTLVVLRSSRSVRASPVCQVFRGVWPVPAPAEMVAGSEARDGSGHCWLDDQDFETKLEASHGRREV